MNNDNEIRQEIIKNLDHSCFISAGAGAGKTSLIVDRVTSQIRNGIQPEKIAVITFTKKATNELYSRISDRIRKAADKETDEVIRKRLLDAYKNIDLIQISTIHSFCTRLLRENSVDAKLPVDFAIVENDEENVRAERYFYRWYRRLKKDDVDSIYNGLEALDSDAHLGKLFYAFKSVYDLPEDVELNTVNDEEKEKIKSEIDDLSNDYDKKLKEIGTEYTKALQAYDKDLRDLYNAYNLPGDYAEFLNSYYKKQYIIFSDLLQSSADPDEKRMNAIDHFIGLQSPLLITGNNRYKENKNVHNKTDAKKFNSDEKKIRERSFSKLQYLKKEKEILAKNREDKAKAYSYYKLLDYLKDAVSYYRNHHIEDGMLTNNELLQYAYGLTTSSDEALKNKLSSMYHTIYVDEFQDTDHVQAELIWKLVTYKNGDLRDGALVVVGDPKQSIYRFRGAEPDVFFNIKTRMENQRDQKKSNVIIADLEDNHRSNANLISWFNNNYSKRFSELNGNITYQDMNPEENTIYHAENNEIMLNDAYYVKEEFSEKSMTSKSKEEADKVANLIIQLTAKDSKFRIYRKGLDGRKTDNIHFSDILLLTRNTTDMDVYLDIFRKNNIPVNWSGKGDISRSLIIRRAQIVLRGLCHPSDRTERCGATDILGEEKYQDLSKKTQGYDLNGKLQYLTDHMADWLLSDEEKQDQDVVNKMLVELHQMTEYLYGKADDPTELLRALSEYADKQIEYELPISEEEDAVRFMNVHKAKGLEGEIVIILNRRNVKVSNDAFLSFENGRYVWNGKISGFGIQSVEDTDEYRNSFAQEREEMLRVEYVAATRAREALIVMDAIGSEESFFADDSSYVYGKNNPFNDENQKPTNGNNNEVITLPQIKKELSPVQQIKDKIIPSEKKLSPSSLEHAESEKGSDGKEKFNEDRPRGNVFGTALHRAFELTVNAIRHGSDGADIDDDIEKAVGIAVSENYDDLVYEGKRNQHRGKDGDFTPDEVAEYLKQKLQEVFKEKALKDEVNKALEVYTELPFSFYKKGSDPFFTDLKETFEKKKIDIPAETTVWVNGSMDLVLKQENNKWLIIDYKSDQKMDIETEDDFNRKLHDERYKGQLLLYRKSLAYILGIDNLDSINTRIIDLY